jgi:hypothetical protein
MFAVGSPPEPLVIVVALASLQGLITGAGPAGLDESPHDQTDDWTVTKTNLITGLF